MENRFRLVALTAVVAVQLVATMVPAHAGDSPPAGIDTAAPLQLDQAKTLFSDASIPRSDFGSRRPTGVWIVGDKAVVIWRVRLADWRVMFCWPGGHAEEITRGDLAPTAFYRDGGVLVVVPRGNVAGGRIDSADLVQIEQQGVIARSSVIFPAPVDAQLLLDHGLLVARPESTGRLEKGVLLQVEDCIVLPLGEAGVGCALVARESQGRPDSMPSNALYFLVAANGKWKTVSRVSMEGSEISGSPLYDLDASVDRFTFQWLETEAARPRATSVRRAVFDSDGWQQPITLYRSVLHSRSAAFTKIGAGGDESYILDSGTVTVLTSTGVRQVSGEAIGRIFDVVPRCGSFGPLVVLHPEGQDNVLVFRDLSGHLPLCMTPPMASITERVFQASLDPRGSLATVELDTLPELVPKADFRVRHVFRTVWKLDQAAGGKSGAEADP